MRLLLIILLGLIEKFKIQIYRRYRSSYVQPNEHGVALILVVFIVALASILVLNLTYSSFLSARVNSATQRSVQAEYLLKSAVNFARAIIKEDTSPEDGPQDSWGQFRDGAPIPPELLGIKEPNVRIAVEIRPEESKIPVRALLPVASGTPDLVWRNVLGRLFEQLGFDTDNQRDTSGLFPDRVFKSHELVANLIDYMDADKESYQDGDYTGIESEMPEGSFPNDRIRRINELAAIPGFTPARLRKLTPFITVWGNARININLASSLVLLSLHDELDIGKVDAIISYRQGSDGPFTNDQVQKDALRDIVGESAYLGPNGISNLVGVESRYFQVIAKVDYNTSVFFMRSVILKVGPQALPEIKSTELY